MQRLNQSLSVLLGATLVTSLSACTFKTGFASDPALNASALSAGTIAYQGVGYNIRERESSTPSVLNLNQHKMSETVCDPFGSNTSPELANGINADLYWLAEQAPRCSTVQDMINTGVKSAHSLFFTNLFTPTRPFQEGFATQTSDVLVDDAGQTLNEWFAIDFKSGLRLPANMAEGNYELALLADDGAVLSLRQGANNTVLIDNDGQHETRMGCANQYVSLTHGGVQSFELKYFQGPRFHIANVLLWRPAPAGHAAGSDSSCGAAGNDLFFDSGNGSSPQQAYKDLLARGWEPIPDAAYVIPPEQGFNPCHVGTAPVIGDFHLLEAGGGSAMFVWSTDIPATTQVRYTNTATGAVVTTDSDNRLRTAHTLELTSLTAGVTYTIEVQATSADNGRSVYGPETYVVPNNF